MMIGVRRRARRTTARTRRTPARRRDGGSRGRREAERRAGTTIAVSVHGPAGVLDLVVPVGGRRRSTSPASTPRQTGLAGIPLLQTAGSGELLTADRAAGQRRRRVRRRCWSPTTGVHRPPPRRGDRDARPSARPTRPAVAALVAGPRRARPPGSPRGTPPGPPTTGCAPPPSGCLMACALASASADGPARRPARGRRPGLRCGRRVRRRLRARGPTGCPPSSACARLGRRRRSPRSPGPWAPERDEALDVWIVAGLVVFAVCGVPPLLEWDARVAWARAGAAGHARRPLRARRSRSTCPTRR